LRVWCLGWLWGGGVLGGVGGGGGGGGGRWQLGVGTMLQQHSQGGEKGLRVRCKLVSIATFFHPLDTPESRLFSIPTIKHFPPPPPPTPPTHPLPSPLCPQASSSAPTGMSLLTRR
jgi:hypothetical protein